MERMVSERYLLDRFIDAAGRLLSSETEAEWSSAMSDLRRIRRVAASVRGMGGLCPIPSERVRTRVRVVARDEGVLSL